VTAGRTGRLEPQAVREDPLNGGGHVHGHAEPIEAVHVFGTTLPADLRCDRRIRLDDRHQPAALGEELGELDGHEVAADDRHASTQGHPCLRRGPDQTRCHEALTGA
jgi:hypothetical protein